MGGGGYQSVAPGDTIHIENGTSVVISDFLFGKAQGSNNGVVLANPVSTVEQQTMTILCPAGIDIYNEDDIKIVRLETQDFIGFTYDPLNGWQCDEVGLTPSVYENLEYLGYFNLDSSGIRYTAHKNGVLIYGKDDDDTTVTKLFNIFWDSNGVSSKHEYVSPHYIHGLYHYKDNRFYIVTDYESTEQSFLNFIDLNKTTGEITSALIIPFNYTSTTDYEYFNNYYNNIIFEVPSIDCFMLILKSYDGSTDYFLTVYDWDGNEKSRYELNYYDYPTFLEYEPGNIIGQTSDDIYGGTIDSNGVLDLSKLDVGTGYHSTIVYRNGHIYAADSVGVFLLTIDPSTKYPTGATQLSSDSVVLYDYKDSSFTYDLIAYGRNYFSDLVIPYKYWYSPTKYIVFNDDGTITTGTSLDKFNSGYQRMAILSDSKAVIRYTEDDGVEYYYLVEVNQSGVLDKYNKITKDEDRYRFTQLGDDGYIYSAEDYNNTLIYLKAYRWRVS